MSVHYYPYGSNHAIPTKQEIYKFPQRLNYSLGSIMICEMQNGRWFQFYQEIAKYQNAQNDPVDAEHRKAVLADIFHQTLDHQQAHHKGHHAAHCQHCQLQAGGHRRFALHNVQAVLQKLQSAGAQHGGNGQEEGEFRAGAAAHAQQNGAQNGGAGPGSAGNQAQTLEAADEDRCAVVDLVHIFDLCFSLRIKHGCRFIKDIDITIFYNIIKSGCVIPRIVKKKRNISDTYIRPFKVTSEILTF